MTLKSHWQGEWYVHRYDSLASQQIASLVSRHDDESLDESKSNSKSILTNLDETAALLASLVARYDNGDKSYNDHDDNENTEATTTKHSTNEPMVAATFVEEKGNKEDVKTLNKRANGGSR